MINSNKMLEIFDISKLSHPLYYYRQFENDIGKNEKNNRDYSALRLARILLPFLSLYKPLARPLSLSMDCARVITSFACLKKALADTKVQEKYSAAAQATCAVTAFACSIFSPPMGLLIITAQDIAVSCNSTLRAIKTKEHGRVIKALCLFDNVTCLLNSSIYAGLFFKTSPALVAHSFYLQFFLSASRCFAEHRNKNHLEAGSHLLMACVRWRQLDPYYPTLEKTWECFANSLLGYKCA
jgi:hypothetical protein